MILCHDRNWQNCSSLPRMPASFETLGVGGLDGSLATALDAVDDDAPVDVRGGQVEARLGPGGRLGPWLVKALVTHPLDAAEHVPPAHLADHLPAFDDRQAPDPALE